MANANDSYISDLLLSVAADGLTISCSNGKCYLPGTGRLATSTPVSVVASGLTANSWLHIYAYQGTGNALAIEASATAPADPYMGTARTKSGDTSRRYLGSLRVGADSKVVPFKHLGGGSSNNRMYYYAPGGVASSTATLLTGLLSQTAVTASAAGLVPLTSTLMLCEVDNSAALIFYMSNPDFGVVSATNYNRSVRGANTTHVEWLLSATQQLSYVYGAGVTLGGTASIRVTGYLFGR